MRVGERRICLTAPSAIVAIAMASFGISFAEEALLQLTQRMELGLSRNHFAIIESDDGSRIWVEVRANGLGRMEDNEMVDVSAIRAGAPGKARNLGWLRRPSSALLSLSALSLPPPSRPQSSSSP